jgi:hypothetical protein
MKPFISIPQTGKVHFTIRLGFLHSLDPFESFQNKNEQDRSRESSEYHRKFERYLDPRCLTAQIAAAPATSAVRPALKICGLNARPNTAP